MDILLSQTAAFKLHILLEQTASGRISASIAELADCQIEADTRKEALEAIQDLVSNRLKDTEVLPLEVSLTASKRENPWTEFIGMFEDDAEFEETLAHWRAERDYMP